MATYYRWRQRNLVWGTQEEDTGTSTISVSLSGTPGYIYWVDDIESVLENGMFNVPSSNSIILPTSRYLNDHNYWNAGAYGGLATDTLYGNLREANALGSRIVLNSKTGETITKVTPVQVPGTSESYVYSTNASAYPNGGVSGSYYYDQRTTVTSPTSPASISYPNPVTTPTITVSWPAATSQIPEVSISSYIVSMYINSAGGAVETKTVHTTSTTFTVPATAQTVAFSVQAIDSNGKASASRAGSYYNVYLAPTLTVPQMVMQGQPATISWSAISGADSYTLQRKANTDADWTQVYSGANLSYSETVGTWTSVQYRVQAVFSGTPGGWAESAAIPVVSSSALVISGTDGDLGTVVNDIPYSISTDTGNQITATITVNSAVIFSGNVGNSTSDVIPVLDLVNGEGTIVIEASVTASGGPVSAVRTWTYTKSLITFPNAGSVAQLTKEGENIFPKTLAECVRLPGGKTLDEVTAFPCQIYAGSYVGTGTSGQNNPTTLTFPFEPKIVFIARETTRSAGGSLGTITPMIRGVQRSIVGINGSSINIAYLTWDNNSLSFYGNGGADTSLNESGITYHYVAIG